MNTRVLAFLVSIGALLTLAACGGGGMTTVTPPSMFTIGGSVSGLNGTLVLQNNGGDDLTISASGNFTFASTVAQGAGYDVTVKTGPSGQTCTIANASGTANAKVTNVAVMCSSSSNTFTISGMITGLTASGLVLQDNGADNLTVASGAPSFTFVTPVAAGATYSVTVLTQPTGETCSVTANGTGPVNANVTNVAVTCSASAFTIGGTITGLTGTGLVLQDNGGDNLTVASGAPSFTFATPVIAGATYNVTVLTQPSGQTCSVTANGSGTANAIVTNVAVTCTDTLTLSAQVTGLAGTLVLQDDVGNPLTFTSDTTLTFANTYASGSTYAVTILTPPAGQICTLGSTATGIITADVTVPVTCTSAAVLTLSASVTGLSGTLVLQDDAGQLLTFTTNTTQTFLNAYVSGATYAVTILTQPTGQTCTLGINATGTITVNTTVPVTCTTALFNINVSVTGLTGTGLVFQDNLTDNLPVPTSGTFTFATQIANGAGYAVTILTQPSGQTCTRGPNASGIVNGADVTVAVTCGATTTYQITVAVTGLTGTLIVQDDQSENLTFTTDSSQMFPHLYPGGSSYSVTVTSQPTGQDCQLGANASGTINANTTVTATCTTSTNTGEWTWVNGQNIVAVQGTYPPNTPAEPGTRYGSATWLDASGNFWLWGGIGYDINGPTVGCTNCGSNESVLSDLWEFKNSAWNFKGGQATTGQCFDFPASTAQTGSPSARSDAMSWIDLSGNLFMFGGYEAYNVPGNCNLADAFNDLWEYSVSANTWTWVGGSSTEKTKGVYPATVGGTGTPGARYWSTGSRDSNGNFWMFGGYAYDSGGTLGYMNDVWEWNGTTWTWVSGSKTHDPVETTTVPGGRAGANSWIDSSGNFWIFGGVGWDSAGDAGEMNDLWTFNTSTSKWMFVKGSMTADPVGSYGTQGVASSTNVPGGRAWATSWITPSGDVYILGGQQLGGGLLNDLWKYSGGEWTWVAPAMPSDGSQFVNELGLYGTKTVGDTANAPGSREQGMGWADASGNLWLFGGFGWGTIPVTSGTNVHSGTDSLNDVWEFQP
ncbi:MAG TPA: hypothetical protein VGL82_17630 [Bryobacteraceae bacterium]